MLLSEPSAMLLDIGEEPDWIFRCCTQPQRDRLTHDFCRLVDQYPTRRVLLCGSGSVLCAAEVLQFAFRELLHWEAECLPSGAFIHHGHFPLDSYSPQELLLLCPAETGNTRGPVIAAQKARESGIPVVCICRSSNNPLARFSSVVIPKLSGDERARPSTKGYVCGVLELLLCVVESAYKTGVLSNEQYTGFLAETKQLPQSFRYLIQQASCWFNHWGATVLAHTQYRIIGYGVNYGTASEGALKFIEAGYRIATAYELEEFLHGPMGAVGEEDLLFFLFAEDGEEKSTMCCLYRQLSAVLPTSCVAIGAVPEELRNPMSLAFSLSNDLYLAALQLVVPLQVFAARLALALGHDTRTCRNRALREAMCTDYQTTNETRL